MSALSLCINMDKSWTIILTEKKIVKILCCYSSISVYSLRIDTYVCKKKRVNKIYLNMKVEMVNRKNERGLLFYLYILVLFRIRPEVSMTNCWYLLNLSGGYIRVYYSISSTFLLSMLRCLKIKIFNLIIITGSFVTGHLSMEIIFLPSKPKIKPSCYAAVLSCYTTENVGLLDS